MRKHAIFTILFFALHSLPAQFAFIPTEPSFVISFDMARLGKKMDLNQITGYKMLKSADSIENGYFREISRRMIGNLNEAGANLKEKFITFGTTDSMRATIYLIPLSASKKTLKIIDKYNKEILWPDYKLHTHKTSKANIFVSTKSSLGVAVYSDLCLIFSNGSYDYYYNNDEYAFDKAIDSMKLRIDSIRQVNAPKIGNDHIQQVIENGDTIEYVDTVAYIDGDDTYESYSYDDDSLMVAFRAWWEKKRAAQEQAYWTAKENGYIKYLESIYALAKSKKGLLYKNNAFKEQIIQPSDIFHWIDYTSGLRMIVKESQRYSYIQENGDYMYESDSTPYEATPLGKFLGEFVISGHGDFMNGNANMQYNIKMGDSVQKYFSRAFGKDVNKKLFDLIKVPQVASLTSKNIKFEALIDLYFAFVDQYRLTQEQSSKGKKSRNSFNNSGFTAVELFYVMMDKNIFFHTFSGSAISAITGVIHLRSSYKSWEYDEEGNYVAVTKYMDEEYPKFVSVFETENAANVDKLLAPFVKSKMIQKNGNVYTIPRGKPELHWPLTFCLINTNNAVIFTNDSAYLDPAYLKLPPGLDAAYVETIAAMPLYLEMNGIGTGNLLREMTRIGPSIKDKSMEALNSIYKATITSQGSANNFIINFDFKNKNRCSLVDMMEMIDLMYD